MNRLEIDCGVPPSDSIGTLAVRPTLELDDLITCLHDYSATICTDYFAEGLSEFHVARTPARFLALGLE